MHRVFSANGHWTNFSLFSPTQAQRRAFAGKQVTMAAPKAAITSRRSVLEPWGDVAPHLVPPGGTQTVAALRAQMADAPGQGAERVDVPSWPVSAGPVGASS